MRSLYFDRALVGENWARGVRLEVADGRIDRIEIGAEPRAGEERARIGVPGLANVHSHLFQRAMAGLTEHRGPGDDDFWTWRALMYRFLAALTPDDVEAIAAFAMAEMLETGFTRVGEFHYLHHRPDGGAYDDVAEMAGRVASAANDTGIGLSLMPVFYAHGGFGGAAPSEGQRRFVTDVDGFARLVDASRAKIAPLQGANLGVAPHSLRAATPEEIAQVAPLAGAGPVHIHAAEQTKEVDDCLAWSGRRPVEWLLEETDAGAGWCLVHATHLSDDERVRLARSDAVAGLCPVTEANLGDGVFPAEAFLSEGGAFGIGTDSNILVDPAGELRMLEYAQRLTRRRRNVLGDEARASVGARLFLGALTGGAKALRVDAGIEVGASADIVALDAENAALVGRDGDALIDGWIFAARTSCVDRVWRRGVKVVDGGRHVDADAIGARYRATLKKLLERA